MSPGFAGTVVSNGAEQEITVTKEQENNLTGYKSAVSETVFYVSHTEAGPINEIITGIFCNHFLSASFQASPLVTP